LEHGAGVVRVYCEICDSEIPIDGILEVASGMYKVNLLCVTCIVTPHALEISRTHRTIVSKHQINRIEVQRHDLNLVIIATQWSLRVVSRTDLPELVF